MKREKCEYCGGHNDRKGRYCSTNCNVRDYLIKVELGLIDPTQGQRAYRRLLRMRK